ncbi:tachykinin-like peptides receptor 86C isoform X2 [Parasteatoda tepidariorum]|uniref:tachykinin-like peptides receptor 86C isoform X2 n=1 Tax=Parasteatoda tepidariorum TaxID=114398 RepID=UPI001C71C898|nr:tachykinin-like peptides receptor 86C isoform X2 [Parasteatoda tepidariorum]
MGNAQPKEIDLLELYLRDPVVRYNVSCCVNETERLEGEQDNWAKCLGLFLPTALLSRPYLLPWEQQAIWAILFGVMISTAVAGNAIVIWIILAHRRMRTITNLFLLNLAIADFLLASGNAIFNFVFMLESHWPFGEGFCIISNFVANLTVSTSVFTILAMSIDRFIAIVRPLRPRMSRLAAYAILTTVWIAGAILSCPSILYSTTMTFRYADRGHRTICYLVWPDGPAGHSYSDHIYNIVFLVLTYALPMVCMAITYSWVGLVLWGSQVIGENSDFQNDVIRSKQRVVHMLVAIVILFGICWLPYHAYFLYVYHHQDALSSQYIQHVYLAIYWLAMSNSCYNPIVYYWMNSKFRDYFRTVMCLPRRGKHR